MFLINTFHLFAKTVTTLNLFVMEPTTGIEPVNLVLTKEALYRLSYVGTHTELIGAGDGIRTRDPQLGRLTLWPAELLPH